MLDGLLAATVPVVSIVVVVVDGVGVVGVILDVSGRWTFVGGKVRTKLHGVHRLQAWAIKCGGRGRCQRRWVCVSERGLWRRLTLGSSAIEYFVCKRGPSNAEEEEGGSGGGCACPSVDFGAGWHY